MFKWAMLSLCFFAAINWFVLPTFPSLAQTLPPMTIWGAIGLSGILMILSLMLGRDK